MKINLYTVFAAMSVKTAGSAGEGLACYGKSFTCRYAALDWIRRDISDEMSDALKWNDSISADEAADRAEKTFKSGGVHNRWFCTNGGRWAAWKLVEQELEIGGEQ